MKKIVGYIASLIMGVLCIIFFPVFVVIAIFAILKIDRDKAVMKDMENERNEHRRTVNEVRNNIMRERDADRKGREILAGFQAEQDNEW